MGTPILFHSGNLIASIQESLSDQEIMQLQTDILDRVKHMSPQGVVIDVSALDVIDSFSTRTLAEIAASVRMLGAGLVVVGVQPEVAMSMVLLGLTLKDIPTALDLEMGLKYIATHTD